MQVDLDDGDVEGGLPPVDPALAALPSGVQAHDDQVEALQGSLLGREMTAGDQGPPQPGVDRLDRYLEPRGQAGPDGFGLGELVPAAGRDGQLIGVISRRRSPRVWCPRAGW
jgi:hypothetical protein